jgi:hypothetical protein
MDAVRMKALVDKPRLFHEIRQRIIGSEDMS